MESRKLGGQGLQCTAVALGCMGMSGTYGPREEKESIATIHRALEMGVNLLDTGDFYGSGHNEMLIREAIRGRRDRVLLSVKFGALKNHTGAYIGYDTRPASIRNFLGYSLMRLGVDVIDFYFPARVDPQVPIEETVGTLADLVKEGKVRYVGLSEAGGETIERAHREHPLSAVQTEYSLFTRDIESGVLPTARKLGIGVLAYGAFSRGLFAGTLGSPEDFSDAHDIRNRMPRFSRENLDQNLALLEPLGKFAAGRNCSVAQLCLAWVLAQGKDIVAVAGTATRKHLDENLEAAEIVLSAEDLKTLSGLVPPGAVVGERYPPPGMASVNR